MLFHLYYFQYLLFLCLYCHLILAFTNWKISNWKQINVIPSNPSSSSSSSITTFTTRSFSLSKLSSFDAFYSIEYDSIIYE